MSELASAEPLSRRDTAQGEWRRRWRALWGLWSTTVSLLFVVILVVLVVLPRSVWPESAYMVDLMLRHVEPGLIVRGVEYVLGTDALGRDVFWRILMATKLTLMIAGLATVLATITGTAAGLAAGFYRTWVDTLISRMVEMMLAFPVILLVLALVAALGRNMSSVVIVLGLSGWAGYTRVIRSSAMTLTQHEFIEAARAMGATNWRILVRHLLPNVASPMLVLSTFFLAQFILVESAISFLGLGPAPPDVTWGGLIGEGRNYIYEAWWVSLFPGIAIFLTVMAFNLLGDAMRDAFDPFTARGKR
jgi:ABC-type dipeptide/oligopeptide/nickel transport system permease subunit